jgi:hypothetical protein
MSPYPVREALAVATPQLHGKRRELFPAEPMSRPIAVKKIRAMRNKLRRPASTQQGTREIQEVIAMQNPIFALMAVVIAASLGAGPSQGAAQTPDAPNSSRPRAGSTAAEGP